MPTEFIECRISKPRTSGVLQNLAINVTTFFVRTLTTQLTISEISIMHSVSPKHFAKLLFSNTLKNMQFSQEHVKAIFYAVFGGISKLCDRGLENRVFFNCNVFISRFPLSPPMKTLDFKTLDY